MAEVTSTANEISEDIDEIIGPEEDEKDSALEEFEEDSEEESKEEPEENE